MDQKQTYCQPTKRLISKQWQMLAHFFFEDSGLIHARCYIVMWEMGMLHWDSIIDTRTLCITNFIILLNKVLFRLFLEEMNDSAPFLIFIKCFLSSSFEFFCEWFVRLYFFIGLFEMKGDADDFWLFDDFWEKPFMAFSYVDSETADPLPCSLKFDLFQTSSYTCKV